MNHTEKNYLEILFEGKNKMYGAYELRLSYKKRAFIALLGMIAFTMLLCILFMPRQTVADVKPNNKLYPKIIEFKIPEQKVIPKDLKPPATKVNNNKFNRPKTPPVIVDNNKIIEIDTTTPDITKPFSINKKGTDSNLFVSITDPILPLNPVGTTTNTSEEKEDSKIHTEGELDELADFPNGLDAFRAKIASEINYPETAMEKNVQGTVQVEFVVDTEGYISNLRIKESVGYGCDEEAVRVLNKLKKIKWKPAKISSKPVNSYYSIPITFTLADN